VGGDAESCNREQVVGMLHEQIVDDELPILASLGGEPPTGTPAPPLNPTAPSRPRWAARASKTYQTRGRCKVIDRISRMLSRSLKDTGGGRALIWHATITVTEPLVAGVHRVAVHRFRQIGGQVARG